VSVVLDATERELHVGKGEKFMILTTTYPSGIRYSIDDPYHTDMREYCYVPCEYQHLVLLRRSVFLLVSYHHELYMYIMVKHYDVITFDMKNAFYLQR
jgi:hypothetical protein